MLNVKLFPSNSFAFCTFVLCIALSSDTKKLHKDEHFFQQVDTIVYNLKRKPESKKGYALAARTSPRFLPSFQVETNPKNMDPNVFRII